MSHVTVHLWRVPRWRIPQAIARMGLDRLHLRGVPGLRFHKLLGTGDGRTFSPADADLHTWGLVCAWTAPQPSHAFEGHRTPRAWRRLADTEWRADLVPLRSRGTWAGDTPFGPDTSGSDSGSAGSGRWEGPVASITRARLRPRRAATFWRAVPPVVDDLGGPVLRIGIGEAPIGLQGTFTIWPDTQTLVDFAYRRPAHRQAISDTGRLDWYAEELFARFGVVGIRGTMFDIDMKGLGGPSAVHAGDEPIVTEPIHSRSRTS